MLRALHGTMEPVFDPEDLLHDEYVLLVPTEDEIRAVALDCQKHFDIKDHLPVEQWLP